MGMSIGAVYVETNTTASHEEIFRTIVDKPYKIYDTYKSGLDFRDSDVFYISKNSKGFQILNADLVKKIYRSYNSPKSILGYIRYDSGDSYGFTYIEDGVYRRAKYNYGNKNADYGKPLEEEIEILTSKFYRDPEAYGENEEDSPILYKMEGEEHPRMKHFINLHLAETVMSHRIGFTMEENNEFVTKYFVTRKEESISDRSPNPKSKSELTDYSYIPDIGSKWMRVFAYFLDIIPTTILSFFLCKWWFDYESVLQLYFSENVADQISYNEFKKAVRFISIIIWLIYGAIMDYYYQGTHGKIICGLKVVDEKGKSPTLLLAIERNATKLISAVVLYMGFLWVAIDQQAKGWHDHIAKSFVVKRSQKIN